MNMIDANEIISFISNSKKSTPVKVYVKGTKLNDIQFSNEVQAFVQAETGVLFGEWKVIKESLDTYKDQIEDYVIENDRRNSAIPLLDLKGINARIEPGVIIRDQV